MQPGRGWSIESYPIKRSNLATHSIGNFLKLARACPAWHCLSTLTHKAARVRFRLKTTKLSSLHIRQSSASLQSSDIMRDEQNQHFAVCNASTEMSEVFSELAMNTDESCYLFAYSELMDVQYMAKLLGRNPSFAQNATVPEAWLCWPFLLQAQA
jgi:hypothetical protein